MSYNDSQVSMQPSCCDTCQIRSWYEVGNHYFDDSAKLGKWWIRGNRLSSPHSYNYHRKDVTRVLLTHSWHHFDDHINIVAFLTAVDTKRIRTSGMCITECARVHIIWQTHSNCLIFFKRYECLFTFCIITPSGIIQIHQILTHCMMTSSNRNIFRVTDPLCGEFTGPANNQDAGDLRRHRGHYDVTVMWSQWSTYITFHSLYHIW